jgi:hypothetical protein
MNRGIVGAAGLDPTFLVQRQLFSQEEILRRELACDRITDDVSDATS